MERGVRVTMVKLVDRLYLVGPPGIGKTEIVRQLAEREAMEQGLVFVDLEEVIASEGNASRLYAEVTKNPQRYYIYYRIPATHIMPEDTGIPRILASGTVYEPPEPLKILSVPGVHGALFIDELSNVVREDVLTLIYALVQEKRFGWGARISKYVKIVAAGNRRADSPLAHPLPAPLLNRLIVVRVLPPTVDEWVEYMSSRFDEWDKRVAAFLMSDPSMLYRPPSRSRLEDENFPTPRSWTKLATTVYYAFGDEAVATNPVYVEYVRGVVGDEAATKYIGFIAFNPPPPGEVARNPRILLSMPPQKRHVTLAIIASTPVLSPREKAAVLETLALESREDAVVMLKLMAPEERGRLLSALRSRNPRAFNALEQALRISAQLANQLKTLV